jgi:hypothetical protein
MKQELRRLLYEYLHQFSGLQVICGEQCDDLQSPSGEQLVLSFHPDGYWQLEGDRHFLYQEVTNFLRELKEPFEEVQTIQQARYTPELDLMAQARQELARILKRSRHFLGETLVKMLLPSLVYLRLTLKLEDFSSFVYPVMRALEGYIKLLFRSKEVLITKKGFSRVMQNGRIKESVRRKIDCETTCQVIERLYQHYSANRHGLFHVDFPIEASKRIETRQEARRIIMETLYLIEETYCTLPESLIYQSRKKVWTFPRYFEVKRIGSLPMVLSTSYVNPLEMLTEIEAELASSYCGKVLFDLLLCNGNSSNRFMEAFFDGKQFVQTSFRILSEVDEEIRRFSANYYKDKPYFIESPLLSNAFKFLLQKGEVM